MARSPVHPKLSGLCPARDVQRSQSKTPHCKPARFFVESVEDEPNAAGRVTLVQSSATPKWARLLKTSSPQEQIQPLQAIFLSLKLFAKRLKGIAALESQYLQQHFALGEQYPEVQEAHLVLLVVKGLAAERLHMALQLYLNQSPPPTWNSLSPYPAASSVLYPNRRPPSSD
ncbi:hypothetical protein HRE53_29830 (plasmid) [Acaryochloris sp. 'Moss Beach']|uniref:hypothetical protein n=1 Tax=Acaryochloris sp. 'Moss Beach' TaxID=2740837 RepID=UPI001F23545F|nr:hypothetical protein [Acaryochloris sp. 'Moss Beach']UJB72803.1 hypothetical protein HRE53_29830 [Acaryochloris sp. 'Moss Beach']